jgi:hypothetical protein
VRVWSVETSEAHLEEVMSYVEEAWGYGSLADSEAGSFPMGTNNELSHPGDQWHPVHSDEGGDVSVPYVIKWHAVSDHLSRQTGSSPREPHFPQECRTTPSEHL